MLVLEDMLVLIVSYNIEPIVTNLCYNDSKAIVDVVAAAAVVVVARVPVPVLPLTCG